MIQQDYNNILINFSKRAEKIDEKLLVQSFVEVGPMFSVLNTIDNQVIYGRRGTGKTHALKKLKEQRSANDIVVYVDLRNIGSNGGIYTDSNIPITERATRLLIDTLSEIHNDILTIAVDGKYNLDLSIIGNDLDKFAVAITRVHVQGAEVEIVNDEQKTSLSETHIEAEVAIPQPTLRIGANIGNSFSSSIHESVKQTGKIYYTVHFGELRMVLDNLSKNIGQRRLFLLLDEWSSIPLDLQPYLADLLRRSVFSIDKITVKIAAIEKRSQFRIVTNKRDYIGIELGCDASSDINLDDYMLFDNDPQKAYQFFSSLIYKHFKIATNDSEITDCPDNPDKLIRELFTRTDVFTEFVKATEGIPRDAFYILSNAAQQSSNDKISMSDIRKASRTWYQRDKETAVSANEQAYDLLHWIIAKVIGERQSRAFLLEIKQTHKLIDDLFDARVLHLLKHSISSRDKPGTRYDVYKIDYGCYVDLLATSKAPKELFEFNDGEYFDVPPDDYRAIRRAILNINEYLTSKGNEVSI